MYENFVYKYIDHCVVKMNQKARGQNNKQVLKQH